VKSVTASGAVVEWVKVTTGTFTTYKVTFSPTANNAKALPESLPHDTASPKTTFSSLAAGTLYKVIVVTVLGKAKGAEQKTTFTTCKLSFLQHIQGPMLPLPPRDQPFWALPLPPLGSTIQGPAPTPTGINHSFRLHHIFGTSSQHQSEILNQFCPLSLSYILNTFTAIDEIFWQL
jgi:hypothetical protein